MSGRVTTFYSYKGGVGRTFLMANVAWLLARWGRKVLCLDWDLEAPGLYRYLAPEAPPRPGVLDLIRAPNPKTLPDWRALRQELPGPWSAGGRLDQIHAGMRDAAYVKAMQGLHWDDLSDQGLELMLEGLRAEWIEEYDHVLIDSRTGISDAGGICAAQLPDLLVLVLTATWQSLEGAVDVARMAQQTRARLPIDRGGFLVLPVPSRIHTGEEEQLDAEWSRHFASRLDELYSPWKDREVPTAEYIAHLRVREQARWSFGEQLPVRTEALDDPNRISYSFANVAALVDTRLEGSGAVVRRRHDFLGPLAGTAGLAAPTQGESSTGTVFVSHPRRLRALAGELVTALRGRRVPVVSDEDVTFGSDWAEALYRMREGAGVFLVVLDHQSLGPFQTEELVHIQRRSEQGAVVIPLFTNGEAVRSAGPFLSTRLGIILEDEPSLDSVAERIAKQLRTRR